MAATVVARRHVVRVDGLDLLRRTVETEDPARGRKKARSKGRPGRRGGCRVVDHATPRGQLCSSVHESVGVAGRGGGQLGSRNCTPQIRRGGTPRRLPKEGRDGGRDGRRADCGGTKWPPCPSRPRAQVAVRSHRGDELVGGGEVPRADHLGVALGAGEVARRRLAGLTEAGEGVAVGLRHPDLGADAVRPVRIVGAGGRGGAERAARERRALRPVARVENADDDSTPGLRLAAQLLPDAAAATQPRSRPLLVAVSFRGMSLVTDRTHRALASLLAWAETGLW